MGFRLLPCGPQNESWHFRTYPSGTSTAGSVDDFMSTEELQVELERVKQEYAEFRSDSKDVEAEIEAVCNKQ